MRRAGRGRLAPQRPGGKALDSDSGILPMINVIFLLLIFFMIAGQLAEYAPFEVEPPASAAQDQADSDELLLLLAADGRAAVGEEVVALEQIGAKVAALRGSDAAPLRVRLRADATLEAGTVVRVIEDLRRAGVEQVVLLTAGQR